MLNEIDPKQAQEQIQAVRKTLQEYASTTTKRSSHNSLPQLPPAPPRLVLLQQGAGSSPKGQPEIAAAGGGRWRYPENLMTRAAPAESIWRRWRGLRCKQPMTRLASAEAIQPMRAGSAACWWWQPWHSGC